MKLHEFYDSPSKWTKDVIARTRDGTSTGYYFSNATCFCILGAIVKLGLDQSNIQYRIGVSSLANWNDNPTLTFEEFHKTLKELDI